MSIEDRSISFDSDSVYVCTLLIDNGRKEIFLLSPPYHLPLGETAKQFYKNALFYRQKVKKWQEGGKESLTSSISCLDFGGELGKEVIIAGTKSLVVSVCCPKQAFFTVEHDFNFAMGPLSSS